MNRYVQQCEVAQWWPVTKAGWAEAITQLPHTLHKGIVCQRWGQLALLLMPTISCSHLTCPNFSKMHHYFREPGSEAPNNQDCRPSSCRTDNCCPSVLRWVELRSNSSGSNQHDAAIYALAPSLNVQYPWRPLQSCIRLAPSRLPRCCMLLAATDPAQ